LGLQLDMQLTDKPAYTVAEVAARTGFSRQTVTVMFAREPGVLISDRAKSTNKRRYRNIRIPRVVFERVMKGITVR